jgi:hypothetical protein
MRNDSLQALLDKQAITDLVHRYSRGIDRRDRAVLSSVYWPDAVDDHAGIYSGGPPELIDYLLTSVATMRTMHCISNILIDITSDTSAVCESYVFSYHVGTVEARLHEFVGGGRYLDAFQKRGMEWRILKRTVVIDYVQDGPGKDRLAAIPELRLSGAAYPEDALYRILPATPATPDPARNAK